MYSSDSPPRYSIGLHPDSAAPDCHYPSTSEPGGPSMTPDGTGHRISRRGRSRRGCSPRTPQAARPRLRRIPPARTRSTRRNPRRPTKMWRCVSWRSFPRSPRAGWLPAACERLADSVPLGVELPDVPSLQLDGGRVQDGVGRSTLAEQIERDGRDGSDDRIANAALDATEASGILPLVSRSSDRQLSRCASRCTKGNVCNVGH